VERAEVPCACWCLPCVVSDSQEHRYHNTRSTQGPRLRLLLGAARLLERVRPFDPAISRSAYAAAGALLSAHSAGPTVKAVTGIVCAHLEVVNAV